MSVHKYKLTAIRAIMIVSMKFGNSRKLLYAAAWGRRARLATGAVTRK